MPTGTVTFLFTDIEGSTALWESVPEAMRDALERHDAILRSCVDARGGYVFATGGDGFAVVFSRAGDAMQAAIEAQASLGSAQWPNEADLRVRMGIHTGEVQERGGDYFGRAVNRAARIMSAGHGGQVLVSAATAALVGDAFDLKNLGDHRLRDLAGRESIFQFGSRPFPTLRSLEGIRNNLPVQLTDLVGRDDDVVSTRALLSNNRLVTLTGVGGVGKTRLALQVAAESVVSHPAGVFFVELAMVRDVVEVPGAIAAAMGIDTRLADPLDQIRDVVGSRTILLVVDNCEHVIVGVAPAVIALLTRAPRLDILATSREPLGVAGEVTARVPSLSVGEGGFSAAEELFMRRALAAAPSFDPDAAARIVISDICRRLDGIPLAIELAAVRIRSMSVSDISARLDRRFRLLTGGSRAALERHQTLRAVVDWSYSLLDETQRLVLDRVSVFAGTFDLRAAETVVGDAVVDSFDVAAQLTALCDRSLVYADTAIGATRYRLLETIRQFAREKLLDRDEAEVMAERHASYYVTMLEEHRPQRVDASLTDLLRFDADISNLRAAFDFYAGVGDPEAVLRAGYLLADYWFFRTIGQERQRVDQVIEAANELEPDACARALSSLAYPLFIGGDAIRGASVAHQALDLVNDESTLDPMVYVALLQSTTGHDVEEGRRFFVLGERFARQRNDNVALISLLSTRAGWCGEVGLVAEFAATVAELEHLMDGAGEILRWTAILGMAAGYEFVEPERVFELLAATPSGFEGVVAGWQCIFLGRAAVMLERHRDALEYWRQSARMARDSGLWDQGLMMLRWAAATFADRGEMEVAVELVAACDAATQWQYGPNTYQHVSRRVDAAAGTLTSDQLHAARQRGSTLPLAEALTRVETLAQYLLDDDPKSVGGESVTVRPMP